MKKYLLPYIGIVFILTCLATSYFYKNYTGPVSKTETYLTVIPKALEIKDIKISKYVPEIKNDFVKAKSAIAFNPVSGQIFLKKNIDSTAPIASITKLMTVYTAMQEYSIKDTLSVNKSMPVMDRPIGLTNGDTIDVENLLKCSLIGSHNDCANTLGYQYSKGYENYISQMNKYAKEIGMNSSRFSNTSGFIDTNNYSSAKDLMRLSSIITRYSTLTDITSKSFSTVLITGQKRRVVNVYTTNAILAENKYAKGLKTGFTYASGECLVEYYVFNDTNQLIVIVLDSPDRFAETRNIYKAISPYFLK